MTGLCAACSFARKLSTKSSSTIYLCERSKDEPRFPKYPSLPVLRCDGFRPLKQIDAE
jgi:hypothetical protein